MATNEEIQRLLVELLDEQRQAKSSLQQFRAEQQAFNERAEKRLLALKFKSQPIATLKPEATLLEPVQTQDEAPAELPTSTQLGSAFNAGTVEDYGGEFRHLHHFATEPASVFPDVSPATQVEVQPFERNHPEASHASLAIPELCLSDAVTLLDTGSVPKIETCSAFTSPNGTHAHAPLALASLKIPDLLHSAHLSSAGTPLLRIKTTGFVILQFDPGGHC